MWRRVLVTCIAVCSVSTVNLWADLNATQRQTLMIAEQALKRADANFKSAADSAGPGNDPIQATKARLTSTRLSMAKAPLEQAIELLKSLPANDSQVSAMQTRAYELGASITAIEKRLGMKSSTLPSNELKLDYKQEQIAKDVKSYLSEVDGLIDGVEDALKKIRSIKDIALVDHRIVQSVVATVAKARQRFEFVASRLQQLPANGTGVQEMAEQFKNLSARLEAADKEAIPFSQSLNAILDPASYPKLDSDMQRIDQLIAMYKDTSVLERQLDRAANLALQLSAAIEDVSQVQKTYQKLTSQETPHGNRLKQKVNYCQEKLGEFVTASDLRRKSLVAEMDAEVIKIDQMAMVAVTEQKPAFFNGGILDSLRTLESKRDLLIVLDNQASNHWQNKLMQLKMRLKEKEADLKDSIIATNTLPPNQYIGTDRNELEKLALATWKKTEPNAEVLSIRIPSQNWERDTMLRWENRAWHPIDRSKLQVQLIIKQDNKLAIIHPINLTKDHLNQDVVKASPMDQANEELPPHRFLLIDHIK